MNWGGLTLYLSQFACGGYDKVVVVVMCACSVVSDLVTPWAARFLCPWNSPGKHTGVGSDFLLQGIFPILVSNWVSHILQADSLPSETPGKSPGFIAN